MLRFFLPIPVRHLSATVAAGMVLIAAITPVTSAQSLDPFEALRSRGGTPVNVAPRVLAVLPERHTGRLIRVIDELERIDPQFDELARSSGLAPANAIQLRTREANVPIFVAKTEATVSTVLALRLGSSIEATGILVERRGHYLILASEVRSTSAAVPPSAAPGPRTP